MPPTAITEIRGGAWSSAVSLETERGLMIMRFSAIGDDFRSDELASRFAGPNLPIPAVHGVGQFGDRWWCISQRMPGVHLDDLSADQMRPVLPSFAAMLRAIGDVSADGTTGYGGWDTDGNGRFDSFAAQLLDVAVDKPGERGSGWSERLRQHQHAQEVFDRGVHVLRSLVKSIPERRRLIHQDTMNFNVTVAHGQISGIFDWGCAMWGDALYDLAWIRFLDFWYPHWSSLGMADMLEELVGIDGDHADERMRCYLLHIGLGLIRYNAFTENWHVMNDVVAATEPLLQAST